MNTPIDRKTFLKNSVGCAASCLALATCPSAVSAAGTAETATSAEVQKAIAVKDWISSFAVKEEKTLDRAALIKLLEERGRQCCTAYDMRQKLIADSKGDVDKLVELMGKIVGPENSVRVGDTITLNYMTGQCGCTANPKREPTPDDPYCECSKANNQKIFEIVSGRKVQVKVTESPRRGGKRCQFIIQLV